MLLFFIKKCEKKGKKRKWRYHHHRGKGLLLSKRGRKRSLSKKKSRFCDDSKKFLIFCFGVAPFGRIRAVLLSVPFFGRFYSCIAVPFFGGAVPFDGGLISCPFLCLFLMGEKADGFFKSWQGFFYGKRYDAEGNCFFRFYFIFMFFRLRIDRRIGFMVLPNQFHTEYHRVTLSHTKTPIPWGFLVVESPKTA